MLNRPKYYNLFLITDTCACGESFVSSDLQLAREIPNGVAYSPAKPGDKLWAIPVNKKKVARAIPYCVMCIDKAERTPVPVVDNSKILNPQAGRRINAVAQAEVTIDLAALGLI